jgi:formylmethanofuran dehydrogenase subunit E
MRHALAYEAVGLCQSCSEPLTSRDVLETGQARLCPTCWETSRKMTSKQEELRIASAR